MIETERLVLRPLTRADTDLLVALHADERVSRFVGSYTRERAEERLAGIERQWTERGHGLCAVELKETGAFIGRTGLQYWECYDETELGWTFAAQSWGNGYATEAARACLVWGWRTLDVPYVTAMIRHGNTPSTRVARRLGFAPLREDELHGNPVTVHCLDRPVV
ncbi:GNAT family N-acetyltransferase [Streptomyces sp. NBC_01497]|uniref:GNAT family N-acetyltransferase n=1 Tax=Streptomyces sp. NBC_01497 TaxID=2903885 RepID=UPI002E377A2E|nr:GNAT family N-acetyltransferase [Streptomyces sp. NBC_01497]